MPVALQSHPKSSSILSGYVGGRFLLWSLGAFAVVAFIIYLLELVDALRDAANNTAVGFAQVAVLATYRVPSFIEVAAPILILVAALGCFWWMTRSQEFTVMRAVGASFWQFARPAFWIAFVIGLLTITVINPLGVVLNRSYDAKVAELYGRVAPAISFNNTQAGVWLSDQTTNSAGNQRIILRADTRDAGPPEAFTGIDLFELTTEGKLLRSLNAERAVLGTSGLLTLFGASQLEVDGSRTEIPAPTYQTALTTEQLQNSVEAQTEPTLWNILALRASKGGAPESPRIQLWFHKLLSLPFLLVATVALSAVFAMRMPRKGNAGVFIASALIIAIAYHFVTDILFALGLSGRLAPWLAIWAPVGIMASASLLALTVTEDA